MLAVFSPIFVAGTKITFVYNFVATLRTPTIFRKFPRKRKIGVDELVLFEAADIISHLLNTYDGDKKLYIYYPANNILFIIQPIAALLLFKSFNIAHLIKNIRNNLLSRKKIVFPSFIFDKFEDIIDVPERFISWKLSYEIQEKYEQLEGNLKRTKADIFCYSPKK